MDYYEHRLPCDATQIGRFRVLMGEADLEQLLKATIKTAVAIKAVKPKELERVIVDTTVHGGCHCASRARLWGWSCARFIAKCAAPGFITDKPTALAELKMWLERAERRSAGYNLRWLLRAVARLGIGPVLFRLLQTALWAGRPLSACVTKRKPLELLRWDLRFCGINRA